MGICLLDPLLDQCDTELFIENCLSWLKTITQILQVRGLQNGNYTNSFLFM